MAKSNWVRDKDQEGGDVFRWYETSDGRIASLVQGNFPNEAEWRIDVSEGNSVKVRGDKNLMLKKSDQQNSIIIENIIRREKFN